MKDPRVNEHVKGLRSRRSSRILTSSRRRYLDAVGRSAKGLYLFKGDEMKFTERAGENPQRHQLLAVC